MKALIEEYIYTPHNSDEHPYENVNFREERVQAVYTPALNNLYKGNPMIEALPHPRSIEECLFAYSNTLPTYNHNDARTLSRFNRIPFVSSLREFRVPLPFHREIDQEFYRILTESYHSRYQLYNKEIPIPITYNGKTEYVFGKLVADSISSSTTGFALIGKSGAGKSSAIKMLLSHYPQVIKHTHTSGCMTQIVYLSVNCMPSSNFRALYVSIGAAIDVALGNTEPVYEKMLSKRITLGEQNLIVKRLIESFAIGAIIFDEIQLLDFNNINENTFDSLLTLSNTTGVAIVAVGTEDAYSKMFPNIRTARRLGRIIEADAYCASKDIFNIVLKKLFYYQWFDELIPVTPEIASLLYKYSNGIIAHLISIYTCITYEYLIAKNKPEISIEFIEKVMKKNYSGLQKLLELDQQTESLLEKKNEIIKQTTQTLEDAIHSHTQKEFSEILKDEKIQQKMNSTHIMENHICSQINQFLPNYTSEQISDAFKKIYKTKKNQTLSEVELTEAVVSKLINSNLSHKQKNNKISAEAIEINLSDAYNNRA